MSLAIVSMILFVVGAVLLVSSLWAEPRSKRDDVLVASAVTCGWASAATMILHSISVMGAVSGWFVWVPILVAVGFCLYCLAETVNGARYALYRAFDLTTEPVAVAA